MKLTQNLILVFAAVVIGGCSKHPPTNQYENIQVVDGWTIHTSKGGADNHGYITISMNGHDLVSISNQFDEGKGRHVIVHEYGRKWEIAPFDVDITDWEPDGIFDRISVQGSRYWAIDQDYDGRPNVLHEMPDGPIQLLYNDTWHQLQYEGLDAYILDGGRRVDVTVQDNDVVPVADE